MLWRHSRTPLLCLSTVWKGPRQQLRHTQRRQSHAPCLIRRVFRSWMSFGVSKWPVSMPRDLVIEDGNSTVAYFDTLGWNPLKSCGRHKAEISGLEPNSCGQRKGISNPDRFVWGSTFHSAIIGRKVCSERKPNLCIIQIYQISIRIVWHKLARCFWEMLPNPKSPATTGLNSQPELQDLKSLTIPISASEFSETLWCCWIAELFGMKELPILSLPLVPSPFNLNLQPLNSNNENDYKALVSQNLMNDVLIVQDWRPNCRTPRWIRGKPSQWILQLSASRKS